MPQNKHIGQVIWDFILGFQEKYSEKNLLTFVCNEINSSTVSLLLLPDFTQGFVGSVHICREKKGNSWRGCLFFQHVLSISFDNLSHRSSRRFSCLKTDVDSQEEITKVLNKTMPFKASVSVFHYLSMCRPLTHSNTHIYIFIYTYIHIQ